MAEAQKKVDPKSLRTSQRVDTRLPGELRAHFYMDGSTTGGTLPCTLLDYSDGGARLSVRVGREAKTLSERLSKEPALIIVQISAGPAPPLVLLGDTRWCKLTGQLEGMEIGLRFFAVDPAMITALGKLTRGEPLVALPKRSMPWLWPALALLCLGAAFMVGIRASSEARWLTEQLSESVAGRNQAQERAQKTEAKLRAVEAQLRVLEAREQAEPKEE